MSCMATTVEGQDLRLCTTEEGLRHADHGAGTTQALATEVERRGAGSDLEPPAEPQRAVRRLSSPTRSA